MKKILVVLGLLFLAGCSCPYNKETVTAMTVAVEAAEESAISAKAHWEDYADEDRAAFIGVNAETWTAFRKLVVKEK